MQSLHSAFHMLQSPASNISGLPAMAGNPTKYVFNQQTSTLFLFGQKKKKLHRSECGKTGWVQVIKTKPKQKKDPPGLNRA